MPAHQLIAQCSPLDENSAYCNLLQCSHFSATSVAAFERDQMVGFISGYIIPGKADNLFIWQVAVRESNRGQGLADKMLSHILSRRVCQNIRFIQTSITPDNKASWSFFEKFASKRNVPVKHVLWMDGTKHFWGEHDSESIVQIGPLI